MACHTSGEPAGRWDSAVSIPQKGFAYRAGRDSAKSELWNVTVIPLRTNSMYPVRPVQLLHQAPARSAGYRLYLEKISPAPECGRERATLTFHST